MVQKISDLKDQVAIVAEQLREQAADMESSSSAEPGSSANLDLRALASVSEAEQVDTAAIDETAETQEVFRMVDS